MLGPNPLTLPKFDTMEEKLIQAFRPSAEADEKSLQFLCKALARKNQNGFDYLEFKLALHEMEKMEIKGELAFRSAFATASALGVDQSHLLGSLDNYLKVLEQESLDFDKALESAMLRKIQTRKEDIAKLEAKIVSFKEEIARIEQAIAEGQKRIVSFQDEIDTAEVDLQQTEKTFRTTYTQLIHLMEADRAMIKNL